MEYLSNIELYFTVPDNISGTSVVLTGEDFRHAVKVMRHRTGEIIYVTNGLGRIFECEISKTEKDNIKLISKNEFVYVNRLRNIYFCLPKLKSGERFEFALEKSVELGITNFIVFDAERSQVKGNRTERWQKIALAAMKQSLRSFLPQIISVGSIKDIAELKGNKYVFEQKATNIFNINNKGYSNNSYFIFGPEGGLSESELKYFEDNEIYSLHENRLRSETAVVLCASML